MKLLVVGAGGIGGHIGGRLVEAGGDVTFLVRARRQAQLAQDGLRIVSPLGDFTSPVKTVTAAELTADYDVAILTCKSYDLESAMTDLAPAMTGRCAVIPMLNGMSHLDALDERFGAEQVWGGTTAMNVTLDASGTVRHVGAWARVAFGERGRDPSPTAKSLGDLLARTKLKTELSPRIEQDMWEKIVNLSALAALTCLFRANVGEILAAKGGREAIDRILANNVEIATREGFPPRPQALAATDKMLREAGSILTSSMLRDLEAGNRVEADHIVGWMLAKAREHQLDDTMLSVAYTHLSAYELRRASGR
jgi:2-dehydropantoate 2-reductase